MMILVLDTNILHQEGTNSGRMQVLKTLIDAKMVKLCIPEIVKREFCTKRVSTVKDLLEKSLNNFKGVNKQFGSKSKIRSEVSVIEAKVQEIIESVEATASEEFSIWEKDYGVEIIPFNPEDISVVLDDYFAGSGAFKSIKNRDDIPDSMIHASVCRLSDRVGKVYFAIKDGSFKKCMGGHPKITAIDSLSDLFRFSEIAEYLASEHLRAYFESKTFSDHLQRYLSKKEDMVDDVYVEDGNIENTNLIGIDIYHAEINFPEKGNIRDLNITNFYVISSRKFTAEISFITSATVHFVSDYGSYLELERDSTRDVDMDSMNGEGMCDLYEEYEARFSGSVEFSLTETCSPEQISNFVEGLSDDDSKFHVGLDIESAELIGDFA